MLTGKTIIVGVCGGIAAYKVVEVVSSLRKLNAEVHVIMTENAAEFVTPLTFQSISHNPVTVNMFAEPVYWDIKHISLAEKADMVMIAPATANIIGKVAGGIADDMLSTTIMATKAPVIFVPAMNTNMYENVIVQNNISKLKDMGYTFLEPDSGLMACGTTGKGRLPQPQSIVESIKSYFSRRMDMEGYRVLITAGPTREAIDPVRYISNHSSGKMGYAIAEAAAARGAQVKVISGPVHIQKPHTAVIEDVTTADEMLEAALNSYNDFDIIIMSAAVADYKCASIADKKIKKTDETLSIELVKNPDIAKELGKIKKQGKVHVGFSAETNELVTNAKAKLKSKNFDMIVANDVTMEGAGFGVDTNIVKLIGKDGSILELPLMKKIEVAHKILDQILQFKSENS
ncbi:MAG: bifunctional phosphopantothenoylcysteine decarboxylase/phosphopantothenate--cysteine ligase CoaBC [Clostridia bacterium]|nr:bifunctional phosphopantothenoylcysteine decarboxylase/phosphopantothenate--cysteine ligase CoaBC [Clostridia bacterium]